MERSALEWSQQPLRNYAGFSGRAQRSEYWWFTLLYVIVLIAAMLLDAVLGTAIGGGFGILYLLVVTAMIIPSLAVSFRRLHDRDKSAWWLLLGLVPLVGGIILLVWFASDSTPGNNRFGPDPKDRTTGPAYAA